MEKNEIVRKHLLSLINSGQIKQGERMPSCRRVAEELMVNKITVNRVYGLLEQEHILYSIPRGGFYVLEKQKKKKEQQEWIDFQSVRPDQNGIPFREFEHSILNAVNERKKELFVYDSPVGVKQFRQTLQNESEKQGVYTNWEQILVMNGAQQCIHLAFESIFQNNEGCLLVENPTYDQAIQIAKRLGITVYGIDRSKEGFVWKDLELIFKTKKIIAFYLMPRHQNPTGYSLSERDKMKLVQLCEQYKVLLIEDDYLADLGQRKGSLPLHYYADKEQCIYIKSFSKTFMPGIRLGMMVVPKNYVQSISENKRLTDLCTSLLNQSALNLFILSGMYEKHVQKIRKIYEKKLRIAREILSACALAELNWYVPEHGFFIWIEIPKTCDKIQLFQKLEQEKIKVFSADLSFVQKRGDFIRLCISGETMEHLNALNRIIDLLEN